MDSALKEEMLAEIKRVAELDSMKADTDAKKTVLDNKIISHRLEQMQQEEKSLEITKNSSFGTLSKEDIELIVRDNDEYLESAQNPITFICSAFDNIIPFYRKNLIVVAAQTGEGKSTAVANIVYQALISKHKTTGKILRTLVLTNEEKREDFYNRVTSLIKGWNYKNHSKFSKEQRKEFSRMIPILSSCGRLTVIDDSHGGTSGVTSSIEGLSTVFQKLIEDKEYYDIVIIDYYQNVFDSKRNPNMDIYAVQAKFTRMLDNFKNIYPAPIVVMSQLKPEKDKDKVPFQSRLMGSKTIMVPSTLSIEMTIDVKNLRTKWTIQKSRYGDANLEFHTGYDRGRFVEYNSAFVEKVQKMAYEREAKKIDQAINQSNGLKDVFEKKEESK